MPVVGEPLGDAERYGGDRCFVVVTLDDAAAPDLAELSELAELAPTLEAARPSGRSASSCPTLHELGAEFLRWEVATAAAGIVLGIDPFDQPNVQESKDATRDAAGRLPRAAAPAGSRRRWWPRPGSPPTATAAVLGDEPVTVDGALRALLGTLGPGDYFALLAYLPQDPDTVEALERMRVLVRDGLGQCDHARLRAALPAFDRPAAQGRPGQLASSCSSPPSRGATCRSPAGRRASAR